MKFVSIIEKENQISSDELKTEYKAARKIGKAALGENHLFCRKFLKTEFIAYSEIYRAFRRVQCIDMKMCCARGKLQLENIVLMDKKEEIFQFDLPTTSAAETVLAKLTEKNPEIKIGVKK